MGHAGEQLKFWIAWAAHLDYTVSLTLDHPPRGRVAVTIAAAATHTMSKVMASPASPFAVSEASGMGIVTAKLNSLVCLGLHVFGTVLLCR